MGDIFNDKILAVYQMYPSLIYLSGPNTFYALTQIKAEVLPLSSEVIVKLYYTMDGWLEVNLPNLLKDLK